MRGETSRGLGLVLATGVLFGLGLVAQVAHLNGPAYSRWIWRALPFDRAFVLFAGPLIFYAYLLRQWAAKTSPSRACAAWLIAGLVFCAIAFQFASLMIDQRGIALLIKIVKHKGATSYYADALQIQDLRTWLAGFHQAELLYHSETHPPGPIVYYYAFIRLFGEARAPVISGAAIGVIAALGIAAVYRFGALWTEDRYARLGACFFYALLPCLIHFFPEFDQIYPIVAIAMILTWVRALDRVLVAAWLGLAMFVASFMAYNLVVIGAFMAPYTLLHLQRQRWQRAAIVRCLAAAALAFAVFFAVHIALWAFTSYEAIASFHASLDSQRHFASHLDRPWASVILTDPYDFFLGSGLMSLPILVLSVFPRAAESDAIKVDRAITWLAIVAIAIVDLSGLLRCETARVWLFLQPLVAVPVGIQLARWTPVDRSFVFALQALIVIILRCKMQLVL